MDSPIQDSLRLAALKMPKLELHAHLNGCVRLSHLSDLVDPATLPDRSKMHDLSTCFAFMAAVSSLTRDPKILSTVVSRVLEDFEGESVAYLELRSAPKSSDNISKREYIECIIDAIKAHRGQMIARYMISIDQFKSLEEMTENAELAIEFNRSSALCAGVDISGNVYGADKTSSLAVLKKCKQAGLKIACHIAENDSIADHTAQLLREIRPDRLGHATQILVNSEDGLFVQNQKMLIECCMTSNIVTKTVASYESHHFRDWWKVGHPVLLCTDDSGTFDTTLTDEYLAAISAFGMTLKDFIEMNLRATEWVFDESVKEKLREQFRLYHNTNVNDWGNII